MHNSKTMHRLELVFWNYTVELMTSSRLLRSTIKIIHKQIEKMKVISPLKLISLAAVSGFTSGAIIFLLVFFLGIIH